MPLSDQERGCIEHARGFLSTVIGGQWEIVDKDLTKLYPREPTPEVVVTNGKTTAAIEVKRMKGDSAQVSYRRNQFSNAATLTPSCKGCYLLEPPIDLGPSINSALHRQVEKEIERVAPKLKPDDKGVLRIPRSGLISLKSKGNPPLIHCSHGLGSNSDLFRPLLDRLKGKFMLVDEGPQHSFFTDDGKEAFYKAVVSACRRRLEGDSSIFSWDEEWQITRVKDDDVDEDEKSGVLIMTGIEDRGVESIEECLQNVLNNALRKFSRPWACLHILVLEENVGIHTHVIQKVVASLSPSDLPNIDYVLLVANGKIMQCYPRPK